MVGVNTQAWIMQHPPRGNFRKVLDEVGDDDAVIKLLSLRCCCLSSFQGAEVILGAGVRRCFVLWCGPHRRAVVMCDAHIVAPGYCDEHDVLTVVDGRRTRGEWCDRRWLPAQTQTGV